MALRINSSDGLVLYAGGRQQGGAMMSLSVSDGHLLLLLDGGKRKVSLRSRKKYNDDRWHTVSSRDQAPQEVKMCQSAVRQEVPFFSVEPITACL